MDQLDELAADGIDDLVEMVPARCDVDIRDFPCFATDWIQVVGYADDERWNF